MKNIKIILNFIGIVVFVIVSLPIIVSFIPMFNIQREMFGSIIPINLIICIILVIANIICIIIYKIKNYISLVLSIISFGIALYLYIILNSIMLLPL